MELNKKYKVVIWGHKLHSHTHSYIHNAYYKAFLRLGFNTFWFDNNDDINGFDFSNCIFFTEDQVQQGIPLNKTSFYILHHCRLDKYIEAGCKFINLCNYVNDCRLGKSFNYPGYTVEKISEHAYYDKVNNALYQPWATDLFPDEIQDEPLPLDKNKTYLNYVGSIWGENIDGMRQIKKSCEYRGISFRNITNVSDEEARIAVVNSYVSPDFRCEHHVNVGYIPCRIFKNISYGIIPATNSPYVRDYFGDNTLPYSSNPFDLVAVNESYLMDDANVQNSKRLIQEVKNNHTYINRVQTILSFI